MGKARAQGAVTLSDIAAEAGCSKNTVSLALRESPRISKAVRTRIRGLARKMGYVPNHAARNLSTNKSGIVGIYTHALYDAVRTEMTNSLICGLHEAGYRPVLGLGSGHRGSWHASPWMQTFREMKIEALVLVSETTQRFPAWARQIPTILLACEPERSQPFDYLALDRRAAGRMGTEHLIAQKHRNILLGCGPESAFGRGCLEAVKRTTSELHTFMRDDLHREEQRDDLVLHCVKNREKYDAIIFGDSPFAADIMHELQQRRIRIPKDLAVISYDYFPYAKMLKVPLSTIEQPIEELASGAVELVRSRLEDRTRPLMQRVIPHKLCVRKSG